MNELENRFYSRAEISEATGIPASASQFARDVKKRLTDEGYAYEWINRRGVQILSRTVTPLMKLKRLLVERLGLSTQVDALDFAQFLVAIMTVPGFDSMPYPVREEVISDICGHNIDDGTLRHWMSRMYGSGNAYREKNTECRNQKKKNGITAPMTSINETTFFAKKTTPITLYLPILGE